MDVTKKRIGKEEVEYVHKRLIAMKNESDRVAEKRSRKAYKKLEGSRAYMTKLIEHEKEVTEEIRKIACRSNMIGMLRRREIGGLIGLKGLGD